MKATTDSTSKQTTVNPFESLSHEYLTAFMADDNDKSIKAFAKKYRLRHRFVLADLLRAVKDEEVLQLA